MDPFASSLAHVVIESERLLLLPTSEDYAREVFAGFKPPVTDLMFPAPAHAIEETLAFLRSARAAILAGVDLQVVILSVEDEEFLGHGGLHHVDTRTPEIGIWLKLDAHGEGYGREAVTALCAWALDNLELDYLKYPVDRRNVPSRRIPESLGGRIEAEYEQTNESERVLNILEYRIYPDELRSRLESGQ
jgi:[ribosomal protein S5]-alanine N-acetyltransferase